MSLRPRSPQSHGASRTEDDSHRGQPHHEGGDTRHDPIGRQRRGEMTPSLEKFIRYIAIEMVLKRPDNYGEKTRKALEAAAAKLADEVARLES